MRDTANKPVYLVDAYADPVVVRVEGRACFQNSACLKDFISEMLARGKKRFVLDFQNCTSMDSTFLGVLAGVALEMRKVAKEGTLVVTRIGQRNLELMRNLGLHRLLTIAARCNNATVQPAGDGGGWQVVGDPTEGALVVAAAVA